MAEKTPKNQPLGRRSPRQERSQQKVELILEATTRLLEQTEPTQVSTNAIARLAGVSIGTLYQYFPDKDAVFRALTEREFKGLASRILAVVEAPAPERPGARVGQVIAAVLDAYGGREIAHKRLMGHSFERGSTGLMGPLLRQLVASLRAGIAGPGIEVKVCEADAFVLTHAVSGVLRAYIGAEGAGGPARQDVERALTRLILGFATPQAANPAPAPGQAG